MGLLLVVYTIVFGAGVFYILGLIRKGIEADDGEHAPLAQTAKRPLSATGRGPEIEVA